MRVWVDRKKWLLLQVEQLEANGNLTTYRLKDHRTNKKIDDEIFAFQVPEGVEVLDRRTPEIALPDE
jgi:outer membrane lipoprotein-sorting protein